MLVSPTAPGQHSLAQFLHNHKLSVDVNIEHITVSMHYASDIATATVSDAGRVVHLAFSHQHSSLHSSYVQETSTPTSAYRLQRTSSSSGTAGVVNSSTTGVAAPRPPSLVFGCDVEASLGTYPNKASMYAGISFQKGSLFSQVSACTMGCSDETL